MKEIDAKDVLKSARSMLSNDSEVTRAIDTGTAQGHSRLYKR